ncbi:MAG: universal stress protein [Ramlibacter sp.]|nr:universal stress protein [Ramlibacter sp.]
MYKRILVPVDGSPTSTKALTAALQLARDGGGRVLLLHVVEEMAFVDGYDLYGGQAGELLKVMREAGAKVLDEALAIAQSAGVEADKQLFDRFGERLGEIVANAAREWKADLIVLGTHGRRGIGRVLLGSGAEQIIRLAPTPVLVIRSGDETIPQPA